jgi:hypothetical protein
MKTTGNPLIQTHQYQLRNQLTKTSWVFPIQQLVVFTPLLAITYYLGTFFTAGLTSLTIESLWTQVVFTNAVFLGLTVYLTYEHVFNLREYTLILSLPISPIQLFVYLCYRMCILIFGLLLFYAIFFLFLLWERAFVLYGELLVSFILFQCMAASLGVLLNLIAGLGNKNPALSMVKQLFAGFSPPVHVFSMYASPLAFGMSIVLMFNCMLAYWFGSWEIMIWIIGIGLLIVLCMLVSYRVFKRSFHAILLYTRDTSLKYALRYGVGKNDPIFGYWLHRFLPDPLIPHYKKELRMARRALNMFFYIPLLGLGTLVLLWFIAGSNPLEGFALVTLIMTGLLFLLAAWRLSHPPLENHTIVRTLPAPPYRTVLGKMLVLNLLWLLSSILIVVFVSLVLGCNGTFILTSGLILAGIASTIYIVMYLFE